MADPGSGPKSLREFLGSVIVSADEAEIRLSESGAIHHQCRAVAAVEERNTASSYPRLNGTLLLHEPSTPPDNVIKTTEAAVLIPLRDGND
jgi:hypothetical protein